MCILSQYLIVASLALIGIGMVVMPFCIRDECKDEVSGLGIFLTPYIWQSRWLSSTGVIAQRTMLTGWAGGVILVMMNQFGWTGCI